MFPFQWKFRRRMVEGPGLPVLPARFHVARRTCGRCFLRELPKVRILVAIIAEGGFRNVESILRQRSLHRQHLGPAVALFTFDVGVLAFEGESGLRMVEISCLTFSPAERCMTAFAGILEFSRVGVAVAGTA